MKKNTGFQILQRISKTLAGENEPLPEDLILSPAQVVVLEWFRLQHVTLKDLLVCSRVPPDHIEMMLVVQSYVRAG